MNEIGVLPDDVLLEIFYFYLEMNLPHRNKMWIESWRSLVHVCRRWRSIVFASPRRLNLQLYCTPETPAKVTLDVWPAFPLIVEGNVTDSSMDNVIAALGRNNHVCEVDLIVAGQQLEELLATMKVPFPELTVLKLWSDRFGAPAIPDSFLDGSAPRLQELSLGGIVFPALPKLLSSTTRLVDLRLICESQSEYFSPETITATLSVLPCLRKFYLRFRPFRYLPDQERQSLPPPKRSILPSLNKFCFVGASGYVEDLVTNIDAPQLGEMSVSFLDLINNYHCPRLAQFINRTPTLRAFDKAHVTFGHWSASVALMARDSTLEVEIETSSTEPSWQVSSAGQICNSSIDPISRTEDLYIEHNHFQVVWKRYPIRNSSWLQLLLPFTAVKNLYLSKEFAAGVATALQELVGGGITDVLPNLQKIFVNGSPEPSRGWKENIEQFLIARQLSGRPVDLCFWRKIRLYPWQEEERESAYCREENV